MTKIRTRIAPSPSGSGLHVGNVRTALFNYLFAKKNGGDFLIRIEDTDQARVVKGGAEQILQDLIWLGIKPTEGFGIGGDHGPYTQMERLANYKKQVEFLLEKGYAYKCYCTEDELNNARTEAFAKNPKNPFKYPGTCKNLTKEFSKNYVVRFKAPTDGTIEFEDVVFGKMSFPNKENYDFVIMRDNGIPLYNFAVVSDDNHHAITHVIRGSDHIKNQSQQLMLYKALGFDIPKFAHLPMVLNDKGGKLSKRDAAVSVEEYKNLGYSPHAVLNYIAKFGWGHKDQEIFSMNDLVEHFDLANCNKRDGKWNPEKFASINYSHLKSTDLMPDAEYAKHALPFIKTKGVATDEGKLASILNTVRHKAKTFIDAADQLAFFFDDNVNMDKEASDKFLTKDNVAKLNELGKTLSNVNDWNEETIKVATQGWLDTNHMTLKDIGQPVRIALTGKMISPELFKTIYTLGRDKVVARLNIS